VKACARLVAAVLCAFLLFSEGGYSQVFCRDITVGAWNIQWLGMPSMRSGTGKNVAQKAEDIADYIKTSGVQLLALEEICDDDGDPATIANNTLNTVVEILNEGTGANWKYILFPKRKDGDVEQHTGLMWNAKIVTAVEPYYRIEMNLPSDELDKPFYWNRWPHAMKFSTGEGKTDFVIIPVHMKSNFGGKKKAREQRAEEAEQLTAALEAVKKHFSDSDMVIIGDTNILDSTEDAAKTFLKAGLKDLNSGDEPTTAMSHAPFDRAFVSADEPELRQRKIRVVRPHGLSPRQFRRGLSDHFMVTIKVRIEPDDD
jgi:hypothetical protein